MHGYVKKGRDYFRTNSLGDLMSASFRVIQLPGGETLNVTLGMVRGFGRVEVYGVDPPLVAGGGIWEWRPPVPEEFRGAYPGPAAWGHLERPEVGVAIGDAWTNSWLPTMNELIMPGVITEELRKPTYRFPGELTRSERVLAASRLDDGAPSLETARILINRIALQAPRGALWLQEHFESSFRGPIAR